MRARDGDHTLPAIHALHLAELLERWEVPRHALFEGTGLDEHALAQPDAALRLPTIERLAARAKSLTGEPALGVYLGLQMRASAHGPLGFAALTSSSVREALSLAVRFAPTRTRTIALRLHEEGNAAALIIEERADFGAARDLVLSALTVGIWQIGEALTGRELRGVAEIALPEPAWRVRLDALAREVRFGQPATQLVFDRAVLEYKLTMADPVAQRALVAQCERALDALGSEAQLAHRVRALIGREGGGVRTLDEVAAELGLSARTLKRRLAEGASAFSTLLEEHRRERAMLLLRSTDKPIETLAADLGYSDAANFSRAFRRWARVSPAAYRRSLARRRG